MTRKQRRAGLIGIVVTVIAVAVGLVLVAMQSEIVFFRTPSDIAEHKVNPGDRFRLGGLVAKGSVKRGQGTKVEFSVTDTIKTIKVSYDGILPDLFRDGQGIVAEGKLSVDGRFLADSVLAKHDENYMPPEVAKALKDKGVWEGVAKSAKAAKSGS